DVDVSPSSTELRIPSLSQVAASQFRQRPHLVFLLELPRVGLFILGGARLVAGQVERRGTCRTPAARSRRIRFGAVLTNPIAPFVVGSGGQWRNARTGRNRSATRGLGPAAVFHQAA